LIPLLPIIGKVAEKVNEAIEDLSDTVILT
jgi:hypothetical protein